MQQIMVKSSADMDELVSELGKYKKRFRSSIVSLYGAQQWLNRAWEGQANDEFNNSFNRDYQQFMKFVDLVYEYISRLKEIQKAYEETEHNNARIVRERNM